MHSRGKIGHLANSLKHEKGLLNEYDNFVIVIGTNDLREDYETDHEFKKETQRGLIKCGETAYDLLKKYPEKNLIYVEPLICENANEKRANALKGWQRNIAIKNQGMIWTVPTDNVIKEKHFNGFHLNEEGTVELLKLINNKINQITEKGIFREATPISNVLATSIYGGVKKEYRFGCKICTEKHNPEDDCPHSNPDKRSSEHLTPPN